MAELQIQTRLQDLHLTSQLPQMDQSQIESRLQAWAVESEGEDEFYCKFEYTKGPFIQFCTNTDQGQIYFTANMPIYENKPTDLGVYDLPQPMHAKIVQAFEKIAATWELEAWPDERCGISGVRNVKTLVECVCAMMNVVGDACGEMGFEMF